MGKRNEQKEKQEKEKQKNGKSEREKKAGFLYRISMFFYKQACIRKLPLFSSGQVERDLVLLYPGENIHCLKTEYYVKKLSMTLTILLVGALFGVAAKFSAKNKVLLQDDGRIPRNSYLEGRLDIRVEAETEEGIQEFQLQLWPRRLSLEETNALADGFLERLPELIAGKNESLQQVSQNLLLEESYEGFPFLVEWKSGRPDLISSSGIVELPRESEQVELSVLLTYEEYTREENFFVGLVPLQLSAGEQLHRELEEYLIATEQDSRSEETWSLPDQWQGSGISWRQQVEDNSLILWTAAAVVALLVYMLSDKDLHGRLEKRRQQLKLEYPDLVHQLALFIGAGMTVRGAFKRLASDYERKREKTAQKLPAYEELLYVCRELQSGVSEGAAYEHFGRRTGLQEYIRLSTLLMQNLKRGNSTLLERLREEADKAGEEKLMQNRRLGEEAGTKLLVPMVLMLAVVMVMVMIPAFSAM